MGRLVDFLIKLSLTYLQYCMLYNFNKFAIFCLVQFSQNDGNEVKEP